MRPKKRIKRLTNPVYKWFLKFYNSKSVYGVHIGPLWLLIPRAILMTYSTLRLPFCHQIVKRLLICSCWDVSTTTSRVITWSLHAAPMASSRLRERHCSRLCGFGFLLTGSPSFPGTGSHVRRLLETSASWGMGLIREVHHGGWAWWEKSIMGDGRNS